MQKNCILAGFVLKSSREDIVARHEGADIQAVSYLICRFSASRLAFAVIGNKKRRFVEEATPSTWTERQGRKAD